MKLYVRVSALITVVLLLATALSACGGEVVNKPGAKGKAVTLNGAGSTFVFPMLSKWSAVYEEKVGEAGVNYQSIGSGGGIRQLLAGTVDFGATDGPMTDEQLKETGRTVLHVPVILGAVVPAYNLPGARRPIKFNGDVLADIFLGKVKKWNDKRLRKINPGVKLPDLPIVVVHRSDGSGTTYIWVDYLAKVSAEWQKKVGVSTSVNWPVGIGSKGNEGVAGQVKRTAGAVGYVELVYAVHNDISFGAIANKTGKYVVASPATVSAAAQAAAADIPEDLRVSITNAPGKNSYPVAGFTWVLLDKEQKDAKKGKALVDFLWWVIHDGQNYAKPLDYAPIPPAIVAKDEAQLKSVTVKGKPLR